MRNLAPVLWIHKWRSVSSLLSRFPVFLHPSSNQSFVKVSFLFPLVAIRSSLLPSAFLAADLAVEADPCDPCTCLEFDQIATAWASCTEITLQDIGMLNAPPCLAYSPKGRAL